MGYDLKNNLIKEEVICLWPDGKRSATYFSLDNKQIMFQKKIFIPDLLGGKFFTSIFLPHKSYKKDIIPQEQVAAIEVTKFRLNNKAIRISLISGEKYIMIFNYPEKIYTKLQEIFEGRNIIQASSFYKEDFPKRTRFPRLYTSFSLVTILLFVIYFIFTIIIGGDALNALDASSKYSNYIADHYYVVSHGDWTEVSFSIWLTSLIASIGIILLFLSNFLIYFISSILSPKR